jgi:hypothetical protein
MTYDATTKQIQAYLQPDSPFFGGARLSLTAGGTDGIGNLTRFRLGGDGLSGIGGFDPLGGNIDGARFYDKKLSLLELRDLYRTLNNGPIGPFGLVASYRHEGANPLSDDGGPFGLTLTNGGASFVAPGNPKNFKPGNVVASFTGGTYLDVPPCYDFGSDFTFMALVRKNSSESFQTILASSRFRFQFYGGASNSDGLGALRLDVNGAGASGPGNSADGTFNINEWYFVALRYNATTQMIDAFLQGDSYSPLSPSFTRTALGSIGISDMARFRLGYDGVSAIGGPDGFAGVIDGARFYDVWLSNDDLKRIFDDYYHVPEPATLLLLGGGLLALARRRRKGA